MGDPVYNPSGFQRPECLGIHLKGPGTGRRATQLRLGQSCPCWRPCLLDQQRPLIGQRRRHQQAEHGEHHHQGLPVGRLPSGRPSPRPGYLSRKRRFRSRGLRRFGTKLASRMPPSTRTTRITSAIATSLSPGFGAMWAASTRPGPTRPATPRPSHVISSPAGSPVSGRSRECATWRRFRACRSWPRNGPGPPAGCARRPRDRSRPRPTRAWPRPA